MELSEAQIRRYSRHILLPDVGGIGQKRLLAATVSVDLTPPIGAAAVALAYLAAAGVGVLRLHGAAEEAVTERDVRAGILLGSSDVGLPRCEAVAARLGALNPDVAVELGESGAALELASTVGEQDVASALVSGGSAAGRLVAAIARGQVDA